MAETKKITTLYVVTDSENSYDNIGDIDGGLFEEEWLKSYIKSHGANKLYEKLAFMNRQIANTAVEILKEKDFKDFFSDNDLTPKKATGVICFNGINAHEKQHQLLLNKNGLENITDINAEDYFKIILESGKEVSSLKVTRTEDEDGYDILTYSDDKSDNLFQFTKDGLVLPDNIKGHCDPNGENGCLGVDGITDHIENKI